MSWVWLRRDVLLAIHNEQLAEHGGADNLRDEGLFDSAIARAENLSAYDNPFVYDLAAAYTFGIIKNHPFVDGNKRTGFIAGAMFLELNGYALTASELEVVEHILKAAAGALSQEAYAVWLKQNSEQT